MEVNLVFDIYCRASEAHSDGTLSSSPEEQRDEALLTAERLGLEIDETVTEVVSGALSADDRELGRLIRKCEDGHSEGIIVMDERRFARDVIAGATALQR